MQHLIAISKIVSSFVICAGIGLSGTATLYAIEAIHGAPIDGESMDSMMFLRRVGVVILGLGVSIACALVVWEWKKNHPNAQTATWRDDENLPEV